MVQYPGRGLAVPERVFYPPRRLSMDHDAIITRSGSVPARVFAPTATGLRPFGVLAHSDARYTEHAGLFLNAPGIR